MQGLYGCALNATWAVDQWCVPRQSAASFTGSMKTGVSPARCSRYAVELYKYFLQAP